jgi:hypothetical protein
MNCEHRTLKDLFQNPSPPIIPRSDYVADALSPGVLGGDIAHLMPAAGQNAVPQPQTLYDLATYWTPFRFLWRRPRNVLQGP